MVAIGQGDIWWAELARPRGSEAGYRRPVMVIQCDEFNESRIATVVCVPLTTNLRLADFPGNVLLRAGSGGLPQDSVANPSLVVTIDRGQLRQRVGRVSGAQLGQVFDGLDEVLGR